ncbi:hypothetical protein TraAM80_08592, partial [Trypanosoma rangeli]
MLTNSISTQRNKDISQPTERQTQLGTPHPPGATRRYFANAFRIVRDLNPRGCVCPTPRSGTAAQASRAHGPHPSCTRGGSSAGSLLSGGGRGVGFARVRAGTGAGDCAPLPALPPPGPARARAHHRAKEERQIPKRRAGPPIVVRWPAVRGPPPVARHKREGRQADAAPKRGDETLLRSQTWAAKRGGPDP